MQAKVLKVPLIDWGSASKDASEDLQGWRKLAWERWLREVAGREEKGKLESTRELAVRAMVG